MITHSLIINLLLILCVAWFLGGIFARFGLPVMLGELLAGIILGPPLLGIVTPSPALDLLAELGIFFVMFYTGMEMDPKELLEHIWPSMAVAVGGFVLPFGLGFLTTQAFNGTVYQSLVVGLGVSITAIAVQSVILHSLRINRSDLGHIIIGAAIVDDILSLVALSIIIGLARTGTVMLGDLALVCLKVVAFFAFTILVGQESSKSCTTGRARPLLLRWWRLLPWLIWLIWLACIISSELSSPDSLYGKRSWIQKFIKPSAIAFMV